MNSTSLTRRSFLQQTAALAAGTLLASQAATGGAAETYPQFKKSLVISMLPAELPEPERFALAKRCGFDGIESDAVADLDAAKRRGDAARAAGVPIHSIIFGGWEAPMSDPNPEVIAKGKKNIEMGLRSAQAMGADNILLVPAIVTDTVRYGEAYERSQKNIREFIPLAEELKVQILIEEVWNKFLLSPLEFKRYVEEFNSPWVQSYFDVGNIVQYGYPEDWIRTLGAQIKKVHIKDFKRDNNTWTPLYEGSINWPAVRKAFSEIGYTGWITAELGGGDEAYLTEVARRLTLIGEGAATAS
jgi:L-ribulose-5-phosphate 3-epimerase